MRSRDQGKHWETLHAGLPLPPDGIIGNHAGHLTEIAPNRLLGAWLCTYRFMYYDALVAAVGVVAILADPSPYFRRRWWPCVGFERVGLEGGVQAGAEGRVQAEEVEQLGELPRLAAWRVAGHQRAAGQGLADQRPSCFEV